MTNAPDDGLQARLRELERQQREAARTIRQLHRDNQRIEAVALRSKQAILGINRRLQDSVRDLEATTAELREAKLRAERASDAKGRFVATISHELRTPMNGILGTAELLTHCALPAEGRELVSIIERSAKGLLTIISDVLDFSKAESGRIELECVRFDLHQALRAIADLELNAARRKEIGLELHIGAAVPRHVLGDPVRLRQVLLNLLDNAVKFTATGGVTLAVVPVATGLRFTVRDTGIGIEPKVQPTLFEPFVQADSSTTRRFGGSGLGLAICRHLVGLMGGKLTLESAPGQGSVFWFECPLPAAPDLGETTTSTAPDRSFKQLALRVLVADDNAVNRLIAAKMLGRLGCEAHCVDDGRQAIAAASTQDFHVVLMDCSMPDVDGLQATAAIRALGTARGQVPIIALTAHALSGDRDRCLAAGMNHYLAKPLQLERLQSALEEVLTAARAPH